MITKPMAELSAALFTAVLLCAGGCKKDPDRAENWPEAPSGGVLIDADVPGTKVFHGSKLLGTVPVRLGPEDLVALGLPRTDASRVVLKNDGWGEGIFLGVEDESEHKIHFLAANPEEFLVAQTPWGRRTRTTGGRFSIKKRSCRVDLKRRASVPLHISIRPLARTPGTATFRISVSNISDRSIAVLRPALLFQWGTMDTPWRKRSRHKFPLPASWGAFEPGQSRSTVATIPLGDAEGGVSLFGTLQLYQDQENAVLAHGSSYSDSIWLPEPKPGTGQRGDAPAEHQSARPPEDLVEALTKAIREHAPEATIEATDRGFVARHAALVYTLHPLSRFGAADSQIYEEEGPNRNGFVLRITRHGGTYQEKQYVPATREGPYYPTFSDAIPVDGGRNHCRVRFSYGKRLDRKVVDAIFRALPRSRPHVDDDLIGIKHSPDLTVLAPTQVTNRGLAHLAGMDQLRKLHLNRTAVSDRGLRHLAGLSGLRELHLSRTRITDAGLAHLAGLAQLRFLGISGTEVTDAGLVHLKELQNLRELDLSLNDVSDKGVAFLAKALPDLQGLYLAQTQVTDACIPHLLRLPSLRGVYFAATTVSEAGKARLKQALPNISFLSE
jgi:hypothetical protein